MTPLNLPGEDALIKSLAALLPLPRRTMLSIGDDAAAIDTGGVELLLITTDLLMEGVHFRLAWGDLPSLGWKALAQNLSDIAAMGGTPTHAVIGLGIPQHWAAAQAELLYEGIAELARREQVDIIGGDTIKSSGPLTIAITVLGAVRREEMLTRAGAHCGDSLYVTGTLGRAAAGLQLLEAGVPVPETFSGAISSQLRPEPRLSTARLLAASGMVTAMMDLSDGLATDLHRLCLASGMGALVESALVPVDAVVADTCRWLTDFGKTVDPLLLALQGGEDFELLFTAPAVAEEELCRLIAPLPLSRIGEITTPPEVNLLVNGKKKPLDWGFTHF